MNVLSRKICFVTGTRAEFGLMLTTLHAIRSHADLTLQIVATGMHLDPQHGDGIEAIRREGFTIDAIVPWPANSGTNVVAHAANTGSAMAALSMHFKKLKADVVLIVGDRVEAFAAASAAHLSGRIVAHIHGGDRAAGQADDCLRHAISKLAHQHFPATRQSAARLIKMGEDARRIRRVGSPGVDGIAGAAAPWSVVKEEFPGLVRRRFALLIHHPVDADDALEAERMRGVIGAVRQSELDRIVIIHPNNDPGCRGIRRVLSETRTDERFLIRRDVHRPLYLGLLRDAAVLMGNSSSGIIESGSFRTPVIDIGPRQAGRERGGNVRHVEYGQKRISRVLSKLSDGGFARYPGFNVYGGSGAGRRIAAALAALKIDDRLRRKLIAY